MKKIITFLCVVLLVAAMSIQVKAQSIDFYDSVKVYKTTTMPISLRSGDMDGDGIEDLVVAAYDTLHILKGTGDGTFTLLHKYSMITVVGDAAVSYNFVLADLTNDGKLDVVFPNSDYLGFFVNTGSGALSPLKKYNLGGTSDEIAVADFNLDGYLDVVVPTNNFLDPHYKYIAVFINNKNGTLKNEVLYSVPPKDYDAPESVAGFHVNTLDLNDDSYPDVIQSYEVKDSAAVYYNKGDGTFNTPVRIEIPLGVKKIDVKDMDHDNRLDFIALGQRSYLLPKPIYTFGFYLQKAADNDQVITDTLTVPERNYFNDHLVADVNNDGEYDLVIPQGYSAYDANNTYSDSLVIYLNKGNVTFDIRTPSFSRSMKVYPTSVLMDDLNGDHLLDLAYIGGGDSTIIVMLQKNLVTAISSSSSIETTIIYPNPSSGLLNIHASAGQVIQAVSVYDAMGRKVFLQENETAQENISLDLNSLPKGLYLLEEEKESGARSIQHFVLQ
ncbi:MAG: Na-Ca exchanger/integrin-beta4 [Chitinophagaceae bacterium]|nr:Na-Ca exchanger/integrin-beta4 [Chitinophagaceae bacterium]